MSDSSLALDDTRASEILAGVAANFDAQLEFTQALVRHPSLRGQEHTAQDFMYRALAERDYGLAVDRYRAARRAGPEWSHLAYHEMYALCLDGRAGEARHRHAWRTARPALSVLRRVPPLLT